MISSATRCCLWLSLPPSWDKHQLKPKDLWLLPGAGARPHAAETRASPDTRADRRTSFSMACWRPSSGARSSPDCWSTRHRGRRPTSACRPPTWRRQRLPPRRCPRPRRNANNGSSNSSQRGGSFASNTQTIRCARNEFDNLGDRCHSARMRKQCRGAILYVAKRHVNMCAERCLPTLTDSPFAADQRWPGRASQSG